MGRRKNPAADPSGLSLIELLIAITIAGLVMGLTASLLRAPQALVRDIATSSQTRTLEERQGYFLADRLSRSYALRRNYFTCNSGAMRDLLEKQVPINATTAFKGEVHLTEGFTIPFTAFSTLGAAVSGNVIRIPDVTKVGPGDLVLLSTINHPSIGGLFKVADVDRGELTLTLSGDPVEFPADFQQCSLVGANNKATLSSFLNDDHNYVFGDKSGSFRLEVIRLARYFPKRNGGETGPGLFVQVWPASPLSGGAAGPEEPAVPGFTALDFAHTEWAPEGGVSSPNGMFTSTMTVRWKDRDNTRKVDVEKRVERIITANLLGGGQVNFGANNTKNPDDITYPSCGMKLISENGIIYRSDLSSALMTRIDILIADSNGFSGVEFTIAGGGTGGPIFCWHESEVGSDPLSGIATVPVDGRPAISSFTISPRSSGGYSTYLCDTPPGTAFTGTYVFFSSRLNRLVRRECGAEVTPSFPLDFEYSGPASGCVKNGQITLGNLVARGTTQPGPVLFLPPDACSWSASSLTDCSDPEGNRGDLLRVKFYPKNIPGTLPMHTGTDKNELTCVDPP